jgi:hypothetical protein
VRWPGAANGVFGAQSGIRPDWWGVPGLQATLLAAGPVRCYKARQTQFLPGRFIPQRGSAMKRLRGNIKRLGLVGTLATGLVFGLSTAAASGLPSPEGGFVSQTQTAHSANIYTYSVTWGTEAGPFLGGGAMNFDVLWDGSDFTQAGTGILKGTLAGCTTPVAPAGFTWLGTGERLHLGGPDNSTDNQTPTPVYGFDAQVISNTSSLRLTLNLEGEITSEGTFFSVESYSYYCGGHLYTGEEI